MFNTAEEDERISAINKNKIKELSIIKKLKKGNIFAIGIIIIGFSYLIYDRIY